ALRDARGQVEPVRAVHGRLQALAVEGLDGVGRRRHDAVEQLALLGSEAREHPALGRPARRRTGHPYLQPQEAGAEAGDHVLHALLAPGTAALLEAQAPEGQVDVVVHDEEVAERGPRAGQDRLDRRPGQVHVALGLDEQELDRPLAGRQDGARLLASRVAASLAPEPRAVAARELLNDEEPGVVPGSLETGPGVPEPHHHVHGYSSAGSPSASSSSFSPTTSGSAASAASSSSSTTRGGTTATIASSRSSITC